MLISIARDGQEIGEWSEDEVRALCQDGQLFGADYYWHEGMTEWKPLRHLMKPALLPPPVRVIEEAAPSVPPSLPSNLENAVQEPRVLDGWKLATFWRRAMARIIDYLFITLLNVLVLVIFLTISHGVTPSFISSPDFGWTMFLMGYAACAFVFYFWDVAWVGWNGSSVGKWVYGLRVINADGTTKVCRRASATRSFAMLSYLWFLVGFPLITLFRAGYAQKQFNQTGTTPWDLGAGTIVIAKEIGLPRRIVAVTLTVISFLSIMLLYAGSISASN